MNNLKSSLSIEEAQEKVKILRESVKELEQKTEAMNAAQAASKENEKSREKVKKELELEAKDYLKRKRLCTDIVDCILENYPKSKKALYDEIGIEEAIVK